MQMLAIRNIYGYREQTSTAVLTCPGTDVVTEPNPKPHLNLTALQEQKEIAPRG